MIKVKMLSDQLKEAGHIELDDSVFCCDYMIDDKVKRFKLVHEVIRWQNSVSRVSTQAIKNRSEVSGAHRKLWRQKESGRARQGDGKACHFRGGGACFSVKNRDYGFKLNKKFRKLASRVVLAHKLSNDGIFIIDKFAHDKLSRTQDAKEFLSKICLHSKVLLVSEESFRGVQNLPNVKAIKPIGVNVQDMCDRVLLFDQNSILLTQERFK